MMRLLQRPGVLKEGKLDMNALREALGAEAHQGKTFAQLTLAFDELSGVGTVKWQVSPNGLRVGAGTKILTGEAVP